MDASLLAAVVIEPSSAASIAVSLRSRGAGLRPCVGLATPDALTLRELTVDLRARPNHCGNPCRRLKPPGGSLSSSVALTVSVSDDPVVYVYVVSGVRSGWKTSVEKVTRGGSVG